jgi:hypothetical protein
LTVNVLEPQASRDGADTIRPSTGHEDGDLVNDTQSLSVVCKERIRRRRKARGMQQTTNPHADGEEWFASAIPSGMSFLGLFAAQ